ncbi:hypothetical protein OSL60_26725, partial [Escherichia coli]|nr:hypothetical protein [Escherichia coli]
VALATMMTSCLTEDPRDQLYEEDIYNNANNIYINAVAVLYNYIGGSADSEGLQGTCRGIYDYNAQHLESGVGFVVDQAHIQQKLGCN